LHFVKKWLKEAENFDGIAVATLCSNKSEILRIFYLACSKCGWM